MITNPSRPPSPTPKPHAESSASLTPSRKPKPAAPRFPVIGKTGLTDEPFIKRLGGDYRVLTDGRVVSPQGLKEFGRINLAAPGLDFDRIHVRNDSLHCEIPGVVGGPAQSFQAAVTSRQDARPPGGPGVAVPAQAASRPAPRPSGGPPPASLASLNTLEGRKQILEQQMAEGKTGMTGDRPFMQDLIKAANRKHPGLDLHHADSKDLARLADIELGKPGAQKVRFATWLERDGHYLAMEFRKHPTGEISLVAIDSLDYQGGADQRWMKGLFKPAMQVMGKPVQPLVIFSHVQRGRNCEIHTQAFSKSLWKEPETSDRAHDLALKASLGQGGAYVRGFAEKEEGVPFVDERSAFNVLSPRFAKHTGSEKAHDNLLARHPEFADMPVNARGETLESRRERIIGPHRSGSPAIGEEKDGKIFLNSLSIDQKRIRMYDQGIRHQEAPSDP